jgi:hypothetical protein
VSTHANEVTRRDVKAAILIAEIVGSYDQVFPDDHNHEGLYCLNGSSHCPTCKCDPEQCDCYDFWDCVARAIGASENAAALYLRVSNALDDLRPEVPDNARGDSESRKWAASFIDETSHLDRESFSPDLEAAALLQEGFLPPGFVLARDRLNMPRRRQRHAP